MKQHVNDLQQLPGKEYHNATNKITISKSWHQTKVNNKQKRLRDKTKQMMENCTNYQMLDIINIV